jgi:thioredoxin-like negative regulator of GroEL
MQNGAPCRALLPVLESASNDYGEDIVVAKINVDENPELATKFSVRSIPAVFLMKNNSVVDKLLVFKVELKLIRGSII